MTMIRLANNFVALNR